MKPTRRWLPLLLLVLLSPLLATAHDDDDDDEGDEAPRRSVRRAQAPDPLYAQECGSCHLAFPPRFLPARSWKALLAGLDDHFGQNAELDAKTRDQLSAYLVTSAGRDPGGPAPLRITTLRWWVSEHDEVPAATFRRKAITSPANCAACHPGASGGDFDEHAVRVPRDAPAPR